MADEQTITTGDTEQTGETEAVNNPSNEEAKAQEPQAGATTTQADKPAEEAKPEADRGLLKGAKEESVPEAYEDFDLGEDISEDDQNALKELAKEHKLTQEEAQKAAAYSRSVVDKITQSLQEQEAKALEEFKAENQKLWESQPDHAQKTLLADKAVRHLGKDVEQYLADSGQMYDARIVGILAEFGRVISEPSHIAGTDSAPQGTSRIYNNSPEMYSNS